MSKTLFTSFPRLISAATTDPPSSPSSAAVTSSVKVMAEEAVLGYLEHNELIKYSGELAVANVVVGTVQKETHNYGVVIGLIVTNVAVFLLWRVADCRFMVQNFMAVMASDFSVPQFRFLERLILVHGHRCYKRIPKMVLLKKLKKSLAEGRV